MTDLSTAGRTSTFARIPAPDEPVPTISWPALGLLLSGLSVFGTSTALAVARIWPLWPAVLVNAVAMYLLFTVAHEASHGSISSRRWVNDAMGRIAMPFFAPCSGLQTWRWLHMQHHNHTNDPVLDPDARINNGRGPALLRWLVGDAYALRYYARAFPKRPRKEQVEFALSGVVAASVAVLAIASGHLVDFALLYLLANRLHFVYLMWTFDYLPHHGLEHTGKEDRFKATRIRAGHERWVTLPMLYQNYHLVHHLYPRVPFHRYLAVWARNQRVYLARDPAIVDLRGRVSGLARHD